MKRARMWMALLSALSIVAIAIIDFIVARKNR